MYAIFVDVKATFFKINKKIVKSHKKEVNKKKLVASAKKYIKKQNANEL